ncbi:TnsA endonuclease N-terminal domain-containing protein [Pseudomonas sp. LP_7_YM]|uniref:TnsA endonuclease N-terminal domain-containing protein n=1 Tax=Pseudomonas sp. LP_7_YM TaxID=2485137 RepID=UPI00105BA2EC|nr:TnsA endonuclease N-terminal domain-containing protein [Pseudomonas sp. LP_7_YM]TDV58893.1 TnsA endonuclease-like protein [Pseudomonas sp. LP_7_YM]
MIRDIDSSNFARDVSRRTRRGRRALVIKSTKCPGGDLRVESALERDVGLMLDIDPRVIELTAQPFTLELQSNEMLPSRQQYRPRTGIKARFYTPDFLCRLDDGSLMAIDAKHSHFIEEFETKRKDVEACLHQHGVGFMVIPNTVVSPTVMEAVGNLHLLRAGYLAPIRLAAEEELSALLGSCSSWMTTDLSSYLSSGRIGLLAGLLAGLLTADLTMPLFSSTSEIRAAHGDLSHLQLLKVRV